MNLHETIKAAQEALNNRALELFKVFYDYDEDHLFSSKLYHEGIASIETYETYRYVPNTDGRSFDKETVYHAKFKVEWKDPYSDFDEMVSFDIPFEMIDSSISNNNVATWFVNYMKECNNVDQLQKLRTLATDLSACEHPDLLDLIVDYIKSQSDTNYQELLNYVDEILEEKLGKEINLHINTPYVE